MDWIRRNPDVPALLGVTILAFIFCWDALIAPFWSDGDLWSNLLPVVHFRQSILVESTFPLYTTLWYGGHYQWMNPLSSFLYLPATIIWLLFPLDLGTRILMVGHLIFSLYMGWRLGGHFVKDSLTRFATAILFTSPVFAALYPGHFEKIMAWPWILFGLDFLIAEDGKSSRNGLYAGMCLAVVALTGANYYVLYAGILFICIMWSQGSLKRIQMMVLGALPGLLHLPNVLHLIGVSRDASSFLLGTDVLEWQEMLISITLGLVQPIEWEKLAALGVPIAYLFLKFFAQYLIKILQHPRDPQIKASTGLLLAILLFSLFATGMIYRNHHLFDTFRVPARAIAFVSLAVVLFVLSGVRGASETNSAKSRLNNFLLIASIFQVFMIWWWIRPTGTQHHPRLASELTGYLKVSKCPQCLVFTR